MPVGNNSTVAKPGSRLRELGLVLPKPPSPLGAYVEESQVGSLLFLSEHIIMEKQDLSKDAKSNLTKLAAWIDDRNVPFLITSIGMIVMLLWAGSYKMTAPGAEGIVPLVSNSPLIWWHFKLFGPYIGADIIGLTEITAAILIIAGYLRPKAGIIGGLIASLMFFITSTMVITTPGAIISVPGIRYMRYMSLVGLFLFKDVMSLGGSFYLFSYFGKKAVLSPARQAGIERSRGASLATEDLHA